MRITGPVIFEVLQGFSKKTRKSSSDLHSYTLCDILARTRTSRVPRAISLSQFRHALDLGQHLEHAFHAGLQMTPPRRGSVCVAATRLKQSYCATFLVHNRDILITLALKWKGKVILQPEQDADEGRDTILHPLKVSS